MYSIRIGLIRIESREIVSTLQMCNPDKSKPLPFHHPRTWLSAGYFNPTSILDRLLVVSACLLLTAYFGAYNYSLHRRLEYFFAQPMIIFILCTHSLASKLGLDPDWNHLCKWIELNPVWVCSVDRPYNILLILLLREKRCKNVRGQIDSPWNVLAIIMVVHSFCNIITPNVHVFT